METGATSAVKPFAVFSPSLLSKDPIIRKRADKQIERRLRSVHYLGILAKACWKESEKLVPSFAHSGCKKKRGQRARGMLFSLVTRALYSCAAMDTTSSLSFPSLQEEEKASTQLADTHWVHHASIWFLLFPRFILFNELLENAKLIAPRMLFKYLCTLLAALSRKLGAVPQAWTQPVPLLKMTLIQGYSWYQFNASRVPCSVPKTDANRSKALGGWDLVYWFLTPH